MSEEVSMYLDDAKETMEKAMVHLKSELAKVRAGKATPAILDGIVVEYYGAPTPLSQVANVNTPDARTIVIQPWEKGIIPAIEKSIINANLGLAPQNDGIIIRLTIPPLTEERRRELVKKVKNEGENSKVAVRNIRRDVNAAIKDLQKDGLSEDQAKDAEARVQDMTNKYIARVDEILAEKEKDIMTV
jgi:ribosome recycling factor